ncbi:MAG TPA: GTP cyclohydrolase II [Oligoflexia bacterium]|nr:GTP cyclohydrolase II [Oligoflexia bacterium]HMP47259.1 GTP cyclohydrolase II [Oligoflexia bacterium]
MDNIFSNIEKDLLTSPIPEVICELVKGRPIVLLDDRDRENEGDLVYLADRITSDSISFMMEYGKGLICLSIEEDRRRALGLSYQVERNESLFGTNFACPFDYISVRESGVTAKSRAKTILKACESEVSRSNFVVPGFVVPVVARPGGVLTRRGQTEGSVDLARLAGGFPAGVICEIMDEKGNMVRGQALQNFIDKHSLLACTVDELVRYRLSFESSIRLIEQHELNVSGLLRADPDLHILEPLTSRLGQVLLGENSGNIENQKVVIKVYHDDIDGLEHYLIQIGESQNESLLRIHSECLTGDVFGSLRCDCGPQLDSSLKVMIEKGKGTLIYLQQEGRGIGLANKLRAYEIQDKKGLDTVEANLVLGLPADGRDYRVAALILKENKINKVYLLTNNPAKLDSLKSSGIEVLGRVPLEIKPGKENKSYLDTKKSKMGHLLN